MIQSVNERIAFVGDEASFICTVASGEPSPVVFWKTDEGYRVPETFIKQINEGTRLRFKSLSKEHEGQYTCHAENEVGYDEKSVNLTVKGNSIRFLSFWIICCDFDFWL